MSFDLAIILATYNQPAHLERVLWGYARQSHKDFELIIADDGSGPETRDLIEKVRSETKLELRHVWHEDRGFRKTEILNRALLATRADYLIFSDGDCIPRDDFVEAHARLAEPRRFLSGGGVRLSQEVTDRITVDDVRSGRVMDPRWLIEAGWNPGRHRLRIIRSPQLAAVLDFLTPTVASWNGNNASTWRKHLLEVNGFDLEMGSGGQDRELGARLENLGLKGKSVRYRAVLLHLEHARPYRDPAVVASIRRTWKRHKRTGATWARRGLRELDEIKEHSTRE
jgi:glycosyltransferase involved in cell wall biosynthesis